MTKSIKHYPEGSELKQPLALVTVPFPLFSFKSSHCFLFVCFFGGWGRGVRGGVMCVFVCCFMGKRVTV